jgi:hypothetical protein
MSIAVSIEETTPSAAAQMLFGAVSDEQRGVGAILALTRIAPTPRSTTVLPVLMSLVSKM